VRLFHNHETPATRRLIFALLLSLILHGLLLFFVRFAAPSWKGLSGATSPLNVILDKAPAEIAKPSAIAEANPDNPGTAKVGTQNNNAFPEQALSAATPIPTAQPKTAIPKDFVGKEILTVKKSTQVNMVESAPDLLVTKNPAPEKPEEKERPYAPAPSVAKPETAAPPPAEKLVSAELAPGAKQEKIVFAEPAQEKPPTEKPQGTLPESKPIKIEEPKPVKIAEPVKIDEPKPVEIEKTQPVKIEEPQPVKVAQPVPAKLEEAKPVKVEESKPTKTEIATENKTRPAEASKPDVFRAAPPAYKIPSLAELSMASVRKFSSADDHKIKFGERRKTVGVKEQDFRYAMYVESVRLKLQRIGMFNYPAAAARDNLSGTLSATITIRADGSLEEFSITRPAPYTVLNEGAERIVKMSAPFSPLPDNIRQDTDILTIRINWSFSNSSQSFD